MLRSWLPLRRRGDDQVPYKPHISKEGIVGKILVHEFITLDGVIETPTWTMDYPFDPKMGEAIGGLMGSTKALLLGRNTYEMFAPSWSSRTAEDDPGAPFMNESPKYVVSSTLQEAEWNNSTILGPYDAGAIGELRERDRWGHLRQRQRQACSGHARRWPGGRAALLRLSVDARLRRAAVCRRGPEDQAHARGG